MAQIIISEFMPEAAVARLRAQHQVIFQPQLFSQPQNLRALLADSDAVIVRNKTQVNSELISAASKLTAVGRLGVGLDNIDTELCQRRNITIYTAAGANATAVAEYVINAALQLRRWPCWQAQQAITSASWPRDSSIGMELAGCCVGLLGFGQIAQKVAKLFHAFDCQLIAHDPILSASDPAWQLARRVSLAELLSQSDILSLHVPLLSSTKNIISAENIKKLKPGAILINSARGNLLDEQALISALSSGHLGGAALDVFADEPPSAQRARLFAGVDKLLLSPHVAGLTLQSNQRVGDLIVAKILEHFA